MARYFIWKQIMWFCYHSGNFAFTNYYIITLQSILVVYNKLANATVSENKKANSYPLLRAFHERTIS